MIGIIEYLSVGLTWLASFLRSCVMFVRLEVRFSSAFFSVKNLRFREISLLIYERRTPIELVP